MMIKPRDRFTFSLTLLWFVFFLLLEAVLVYWLPRTSLSIEGAFDAYDYAALVASDDTAILESQPFLAIYFSVRKWLTPEMFAPFLHLSLILPALFLLTKNPCGRELIIPVTTALAFPEFLLFLGSVSKEGLAIAGMVWCIVAFAMHRTGKPIAMLFALGVAILIFEYSRPYFPIVPAGALLIAIFLNVRTQIKLLLITSAIIVSSIIYFTLGDVFGATVVDINEKINANVQFLTWFETNMESDSAIKNYVRKLLSITLFQDEPHWSIFFLGPFFLLLKATVYTFAIPLISPPAFKYSAAYIWALLWQVAASATSLFVLYFVVKHLPRALRQGSQNDRLLILFAVSFAIAIAASTLIFHVRYRAPAEFLLLVLALQAIRHRISHIVAVNTINVASLGFALVFLMPMLL